MDLSLIIGAYDMERELPRTIYSVGPSYQRNIESLDYEIIVVDNGSPQPVDEQALRRHAQNVRVVRVDEASTSPVGAINRAVQDSSGRLVGLFIDGARMLSPGLIRHGFDAYKSDPTKVVGTLGCHLGPDVQMRSVVAGYNQAAEDELLASVAWKDDGYALFSIAVLAGSSARGWFGPCNESNGVFLDRALWNDLAGLDERFEAPGGGYANIDFWHRAVAASDNEPWMILGEATFHQVHGGAATNGSAVERQAMLEEFKAIRGGPPHLIDYQARLFGTLDPTLAAKFLPGETTPVRHAHSVGNRAFAVGVEPDLLDTVQAGTLKTHYKGRRLAKNPFDLALYLRLLQKLKPRTIIEVGTSEGGSAQWLRDQCIALGINCRILTMDIKAPTIDLDGVAVFTVDANRPAETFPHSEISAAEHPWLVIEDSAHTFESTTAVLEYFEGSLEPGDYLVVEDGVVADLRGSHYRQFEDGPNRAVRDFLLRTPGTYEIDADLCDLYGSNVTYCPNAWLRRTSQ